MIKKICFAFLIFQIFNLFSWDNSYAEYMPFFPYRDGKAVYDDSALSKISYNLAMHNYQETYKLFKENTNLITQKNYEKSYKWKHKTEYHKQRPIYNMFLPYIFEKLIILKDMSNFKKEFTRFSVFPDIMPQHLYFFRCYILYKNGEYEKFRNLYSEIVENNWIESSLSKKYIRPNDIFELEYYARLVCEKDYDINKAIQILEDCMKKQYYPTTFFLISRLRAKIDHKDAAEYLEYQLDNYFVSDYFAYPMSPYMDEIERMRMYLAYLYYSLGNNVKALEHFHLAVDSKLNGSTFLGDWDYWLSNRDYEEGEYEVMLILKEMYIDQYRK